MASPTARFSLLLIALLIAIPDVRAAQEEPPKVPTYRITAVEPDGNDTDEDASSRRQRKVVEPAIRIKFDQKTELNDLRGAISFVPEAEVIWRRSSNKDENTVRLVGSFQRERDYELVITGPIPSVDRTARVELGRHKFRLPAVAAELKFVNLGAVIERESKQLVHLEFCRLDKIKLSAAPVPLVSFLSPQGEVQTVEDAVKKKKTRRRKPATNAQAAAVPVVKPDEWAREVAELAKIAGRGPFAALGGAAGKTESELFSEPGELERNRRTSLPLTWRESKARGGPYVVWAETPDGAASTAKQLVTITDLGVSAKTSTSGATVWVTKLSTGDVVAGANVFLSAVDGRVWAAGATDEQGLVRVKDGDELPLLDLGSQPITAGKGALELAKAVAFVAVTDSDAAWLSREADGVKARTANRGDIYGDERFVKAHVFTERGVYRPGEKVHYKVTARYFSGGEVELPRDGNARVRVRVENPRGAVARELDASFSEFGTVSGAFDLKAHEPLGEWSIEVLGVPTSVTATAAKDEADGGDSPDEVAARRSARVEQGKVWGATTFRMEEYVPPRHRVEVFFKEKTDAAERTLTGVVQGVYFAGGPVKHGKVRWRVALAGAKHAVPGTRGYSAGTDGDDEQELLDSGEATLDAAGSLGIDIPVSPEVADGRRSLILTATVLDFDARAATGEGRHKVAPKWLVGISDDPTTVDGREPVDLTALVVGREGGQKVQAGDLEVVVFRKAHTHVQKRNQEGDFYDAPHPVMIRAFEFSAKLKDGIAPIKFDSGGAGTYVLEVGYRAPDGQVYRSSRTFKTNWYTGEYDYWCGESDDHMGHEWHADRLHALTISGDRNEAVPGETVRLWVRAPRPVKSMLLSIERERVIEVKRVTPAADGAIDIAVPEGFTPNVFVSVLAAYGREGYPVYPTDADTLAPSFGHGYFSLPVKREKERLDVTVKGAAPGLVVRPGAKHTVTVTVKDAKGAPVKAEVALAVVDEAILSLTGFATPELDALFDVSMPLSVKTADSRRGISLQTPYRALTVRPLTGGDGGDGRQSKTRENFDPVSCFEPKLVTDANGEASATFTLPDAMTQYRVYAVVVDRETHHGSVAKPLVVKKPFYLEAGLPRFFTEGDRGSFLVAVFNETGAGGEVSLTATAAGGLAVQVPAPKVAVANGDRAQVPVSVVASEPVHTKVEIEARLGEHSDRVAIALPVREATIMRTHVFHGMVEDRPTDVPVKLPEPVSQLSKERARRGKVELTLSSVPTLGVMGALKYLLQYPHGCVEQTSSRVFPLAGLREMIKAGHLPGLTVADTDPKLAAGVARLLSMQTESGGFGYWPGDRTPHAWGSCAATLALVYSKNAGVEVPAEALERAVKYLTAVVDGTNLDAKHAMPIAFLALAEAGKPAGDPGRAAQTGTTKYVGEDRLVLLMAAAKAGAKKDDLKADLASALSEVESWSGAPWEPASFYTTGRARAIALLALMEIDPEDPRVAALAESIGKSIGPQGYWHNTQETTWSVTALGRLALRAAKSGPVTAKVAAPGLAPQTLELSAGKHEAIAIDPVSFLSRPELALERASKGVLMYRLAATYPWFGPEVSDANAKIKRTYRRLAGDGPIRVGDLVEVELLADLPWSYDYGALVDPLPAGLVAVNSALKSEQQPVQPGREDYGGYVGNDYVSTFQPAYLEIRDDRVSAYRNYGWGGKQRFSYVARAVMEGTFAVPPAQLEPMYKPETAIYSPPATLTVQPASK
jgi:uncharacterized protein YfaS (alpha-2-macroglobulin family)